MPSHKVAHVASARSTYLCTASQASEVRKCRKVRGLAADLARLPKRSLDTVQRNRDISAPAFGHVQLSGKRASAGTGHFSRA